jgi:hypothetical protein
MPKGLTGNQLKLIAMLTMTVDHIGMILFPHVLWMRLVGRLAFPIYAFMIAQGCHHTRSMPKYLRSVAVMALLCQIVTVLAGSYHQCILVTFSMSISLIWLLQKARQTRKAIWWVLFVAALAAVWFITQTLPELLPGTDYRVDYDFLGVILPVVIWLMPNKTWQLLAAAGILLLMSVFNFLQLPSLAAIALLALYNGQRGKHNIKQLFYWYYPLHLGILYLVEML